MHFPETNATGTESRSAAQIHFVSALLSMLVLSGMVIANLPYRYVETNGLWLGVSQSEEMNRIVTLDDMPTMAGWPLRYDISYASEGGRDHRLWSPFHLLGNITFTAFIVLAVYSYVWFRGQCIATGKNRRRLQLLDLGIALVIVIVPTAIMGSEYRVAKQHQRLAKQITRSGNCFMSAWVPEIMMPHIPMGLQQLLLRVRSIDLNSANHHLTGLACNTDGLVTFTCSSCRIRGDDLASLARHPHLRGLQISRHKLGTAEIEAIANCRYLKELDLSRTNLNHVQLNRLKELRLESINLTETDLRLSDLGKPGWSQTAKVLVLSRPKKGSTASLEINDWPNLRNLRVFRTTSISNPSTLKIKLANLPLLETVSLDRNQKHALELDNLPLLSSFDEGLGFLQTIIRDDAQIPGNMWLTHFTASRTPSLQNFGCYARDLKHLSIEEMQNLRSFELGSYKTSFINGMHTQKEPLEFTSRWLQQLGERTGPSTLNLTGFPLENADLTPLSRNSGIRHLNLFLTGITFDQIRQLAGMQQLETLQIRGCELETESLSWILDEFPKLDELVINGESIATVDLSQHDHLRRLRISKLNAAKRVSLVDVPLLKTELHLEQCPEQLEIRNAKSLLGLSINAPWPKHAKLKGMRDLDWFAVGGRNVTDTILDEVLVCKNLDQLTLAYASISPAKLKLIGKLKTLSILSVPGCKLEPEVISAWSQLKSLWDINLDDTQISVGTITWLSNIASLRRVSMNRVQFDDYATEKLADLKQVSELQLAGVQIPNDQLMPLLVDSNIESINLSGWKIDDKLLQQLLNTPSLKMMTLHDCGITQETMRQIMERLPTAYIDLGSAQARLDPALQQELERRIRNLTVGTVQGWRTAARKRFQRDSGNESDNDQLTYRESDRIEVGNFR